MASSPFFRLPREIRDMIYWLLFETAHEDKTVTPDPTGSRRQNNLGHRTLNLSDSLPFLRTCQSVHEEATAVLYGNNVFRFDDHPHNSDEHTMPAFNTSVPYCDYLTMYFFLVSIGKSNREKLQHIHLDFSEATFVRYPEEVGIYGNLRENAGASFIGDAVELLAASHNLQTVSVSFNATSVSQKDKWSYSSAMLDYFYICSKLARKISAITGIEQFKCLTTYEAREDEYDGFFCKAVKDMKAKMEVRYPPPLNPLSRLTYDREPIAQVEGGRGSGTKVVGNRSPLSPTKVSNDFCPRPSGVTKDAARAGSTDDGNATKATTTIWSEAQSMPTSRRPLIQEPGQDLPAA